MTKSSSQCVYEVFHRTSVSREEIISEGLKIPTIRATTINRAPRPLFEFLDDDRSTKLSLLYWNDPELRKNWLEPMIPTERRLP